MGLGGFVLGGALAGAGKGLAMQAEQSALERREARLQAARAAERTENRQWDVEDTKTAANNAALLEDTRHKNRITELGLGAKAEATLAEMRDGSKPFAEQYDFNTNEMVYLWRDKTAPGGVREDRRKINPNKPAAPKEPEVKIEKGADGTPIAFTIQGGSVSARPISGVKLDTGGEGGGKRKLKRSWVNWENIPVKEYDDGTYEGPEDRRSMADLKKDYPEDFRYAQNVMRQRGKDKATVAKGPPTSKEPPKNKGLDQTPATEGGYKYTPGPGGRANQANWSKA